MLSLNQWLERIESLHPNHIELTLDRVINVANRAQVAQFSEPVITIAGTNGKGSVVASLNALSKALGKKPACYTSPHLLRFTERLTIDGTELSEQQWCDAFQYIDECRNGESLTYFEFVTLAALWLIKQSDADLIILEIGLGGRLDAVNLVPNDVAVITSIGFDHEDWLGDTLDQIAKEKAGIINANSKVVVANAEVAELIRPFAKTHDFAIAAQREMTESHFTELVDKLRYEIYPDSFYCALNALKQLGTDLSQVDVQAVAKHLVLSGRWQQFKPYQIWCDVAHNPQATGYLTEKVKSISGVDTWHFIVGMLKDKRALNSLSQFSDVKATWYCVDTEGPRGMKGADLAKTLSQHGLSTKASDKVESALAEVLKGRTIAELPSEQGIVAFGSFHVVAKMIEYMKDLSV